MVATVATLAPGRFNWIEPTAAFSALSERHTREKWPFLLHFVHSCPLAGHSDFGWRLLLPQFQHPSLSESVELFGTGLLDEEPVFSFGLFDLA